MTELGIATPKLRFKEFAEEWRETTLGEVGKTFNGLTGKSGSDFDSGLPFITYKQIFDSSEIDLQKTGQVEVSADEKQNVVKYGDIFFTGSSETPEEVGFSSVLLSKPDQPTYLNSFCFGFRANSMNILDPQFARSYFRSPVVRDKIMVLAQGSTRFNISKLGMMKIKVNLPSQAEQKKIAGFLSAVDAKIEILQRQSELLEKYKTGVMQKIFAQKIRFADKSGKPYPDWETKKLGAVFSERTERSGEGELISVTINSGLVPFSDIERKNNSSEDKSNYKVVRKGDIAYNSMRMWQGASGISKYDGIVSPAYTVIISNDNNSSKFWSYRFKKTDAINIFQRHSQGLTSDTWNLKYKPFSKIEFMVPTLAEQQQIATFLSALDDKIKLENDIISSVTEFKKSLLQIMFV